MAEETAKKSAAKPVEKVKAEVAKKIKEIDMTTVSDVDYTEDYYRSYRTTVVKSEEFLAVLTEKVESGEIEDADFLEPEDARWRGANWVLQGSDFTITAGRADARGRRKRNPKRDMLTVMIDANKYEGGIAALMESIGIDMSKFGRERR